MTDQPVTEKFLSHIAIRAAAFRRIFRAEPTFHRAENLIFGNIPLRTSRGKERDGIPIDHARSAKQRESKSVFHSHRFVLSLGVHDQRSAAFGKLNERGIMMRIRFRFVATLEIFPLRIIERTVGINFSSRKAAFQQDTDSVIARAVHDAVRNSDRLASLLQGERNAHFVFHFFFVAAVQRKIVTCRAIVIERKSKRAAERVANGLFNRIRRKNQRFFRRHPINVRIAFIGRILQKDRIAVNVSRTLIAQNKRFFFRIKFVKLVFDSARRLGRHCFYAFFMRHDGKLFCRIRGNLFRIKTDANIIHVEHAGKIQRAEYVGKPFAPIDDFIRQGIPRFVDESEIPDLFVAKKPHTGFRNGALFPFRSVEYRHGIILLFCKRVSAVRRRDLHSAGEKFLPHFADAGERIFHMAMSFVARTAADIIVRMILHQFFPEIFQLVRGINARKTAFFQISIQRFEAMNQ